MIDIEKIEQAYQKATAGEWIADHVSSEGPYKLHSVQPRVCDVFYQTEKGAATADCIALLHNAWPQIRRELEAAAELIALAHTCIPSIERVPRAEVEWLCDSRPMFEAWLKRTGHTVGVNFKFPANEALAQYDRSGT